MIERAIAAGVPFAWVAADSVYGVGDVEMALRRAGKGYVLGVNSSHHFRSWQRKPPVAGTAEEIAQAPSIRRDGNACRRATAQKARGCTTGCICELADLDAAEYDDARSGLWTRGLLIRRNIADGDLAFFSTWCPAGTGIETLVKIEGHRWAIEDSFETAKNELGLDHNETRSWHGWHRHVSLVMLAFAMMAAIRHRANTATPPKRMPGRRTTRPAADPLVDTGNPAHCRSGSRDDASSPPTSSPGHSGDELIKPQPGKAFKQKNATVMLVLKGMAGR